MKTSTVSLLLFLVFFSPDLVHGSNQGSASDGPRDGKEWYVLKGKHFLVHCAGNVDFARKICLRAEEIYRGIASDLGFPKYDDFWLWDNRVKIYIYRSRREFMHETGAPKWAAAKASCEKNEIATFEGSANFLDSGLPHELTHLIFRDFVGFETQVPLWLHEGIAEWEERKRRGKVRHIVRGLFFRKRLIPLNQLIGLNIRKVNESRKAAEFYAQSASLVGYMIEEHGSGRFRKFCGQLRDGKDLNAALSFTYPDTIRNIDELEKGWKMHLDWR